MVTESYERRLTSGSHRHSAETPATAVLDRAGVLVAVNEQWQSFCLANGGTLAACGVGVSYLDVCAAAGDDPVARHAAAMVRKALLGDVPHPVTVLTPCPAPGTSGWFDMRVVSRIEDDGTCDGAVVSFCERVDLGPTAPAASTPVPPPLPAVRSGRPESTTVATPREMLTFPDIPRLELEESLLQLTERAADVLKAQGRLRELLRANALVTADLKLEVVLRRVVHAARDLIGARYAALGVLGEDGLLDQFVHAGMPQENLDRLEHPPLGDGILGLLVDEPGPVRLKDVSIDPRAIGFPEGHPSMTSFLGVPIRVRGMVFGNLYLAESERGEFSEEDEQLITSLARTAAVAIENARLYEDSERRRRWQAVTADATQALFAGEHDEPLQVVLEGARQGAEADLAIFASLGDGVVTAEVVVGELADQLTGLHSDADLSPINPVLTQGTPLLIESYRRRDIDPPLNPPVSSLIAAPLLRGTSVVGAIVTLRLQGRRAFDHTDIEQLEAYVGHVGVALEVGQSRADQEALTVLREHQRIAADLHDHVIQELFATGMALQGMVYRTDDPKDQAQLVEFVDAIDATIRRIRTTIFRLNRAPHGAGSLKERLLSVVEAARATLGFTPHAEFSGPLDQAVPDELADHVVAVAREALSNAARHADASSVRLRVTLADRLLTVETIDDGVGIGQPTRSSGLANLERRAKEYNGSMEILPAPGGGTHLRWTAVAELD